MLGSLIYSILNFNMVRGQIKREERPYIWITHPVFDPPQPNTNLTGQIVFKNFGKSLAVDVRPNDLRDIFIGTDAMQRADNFFSGYENIKIIDKREQSLPLPPEDAQDPESFASIKVASFGIPPANVYDWAITHDGGVIMVGVVRYKDASGESFYTEYCVVRYASGNAGPCDRHNEIH